MNQNRNRKETDEGSQACRTATKAEVKVPASENSRRGPVTLRELDCNKMIISNVTTTVVQGNYILADHL